MTNDFLDQLSAPLQGESLALSAILLRLLTALLLGAVVAQIYRRTAQNAESGASFPMTLILLSVLIAMVTQVIGSNVARAFSLVGALSVVRFRTVVRDTRDTAYVIFAVVVGMAVGAANLMVAAVGVVVIAAVSWAVKLSNCFGVHDERYLLKLRSSVGQNPQALAATPLAQCTTSCELVGIASSKQGVGLDYSYEVTLRSAHTLSELVVSLSLIEGIQDVRCERREDR